MFIVKFLAVGGIWFCGWVSVFGCLVDGALRLRGWLVCGCWFTGFLIPVLWFVFDCFLVFAVWCTLCRHGGLVGFGSGILTFRSWAIGFGRFGLLRLAWVSCEFRACVGLV